MSPLRHRMIEDMQVRNLSPYTQRNYLYAIARLARHFATAPIDSWLERLGAARVPSAPVAPLGQAMQQAVLEGRVPAMPAGAFGTLRTVAAPFLFDGKRPEVARSAPALGEHSREVLRECGYSAREVGSVPSM